MGVSVGTTQFGFYSFCLKLTLKISINFDIKLCAHVCSSTESKAITEIVTCKSNDIVIFRQILRKCHCIWLTNENFPLFYLIHCAFIQLNPPKKKYLFKSTIASKLICSFRSLQLFWYCNHVFRKYVQLTKKNLHLLLLDQKCVRFFLSSSVFFNIKLMQ